MNPIKITSFGIFKLLSNINPNKATGPDDLPGKFLKLCANEVANIYTILFQASLDQGIVPPDWKKGNIVPLYKKGDKSLPENYRPITLLDTLYKVYTRLLANRLSDTVEPFLRKSQYGLRRHRSTVHAIHVVRRTFDALCHKTDTDLNLLLCDWNKAFDKVDTQALTDALKAYGVGGTFLQVRKMNSL